MFIQSVICELIWNILLKSWYCHRRGVKATNERHEACRILTQNLCFTCSGLQKKMWLLKHYNLWDDFKIVHSSFLGTGLPAYIDSVGTAKKCHYKRNVTVSRIFNIRRSFLDPKECYCNRCHCKRVWPVSSVNVTKHWRMRPRPRYPCWAYLLADMLTNMLRRGYLLAELKETDKWDREVWHDFRNLCGTNSIFDFMSWEHYHWGGYIWVLLKITK